MINKKRDQYIKLYTEANIRSKILIIVIIICTFSFLSMAIASFLAIGRVSNYSLDTNYNFGQNITNIAETTLLEQAQYFLQSIAHEQSQNINSILDEIRFKVILLHAITSDILNNPEYNPTRRHIYRHHEDVEGIFRSNYILHSDIEITPQIDREIDLLSNLVFIMPILTENPNIVDLYVGMESGLFYNYSSRTVTVDYDPHTRPWYSLAKEHPEEVVFTQIYQDSYDQGDLAITAAKSIFDKTGQFLGVAALDIRLDNLQSIVFDAKVVEGGYAFIFDRTGRYIVHPRYTEEGFEMYPLRTPSGLDIPFANAYINMMHNEEGFSSDIINGNTYFLIHSPISVTGWSIGVVVPEAYILSSLEYFTNRIDVLSNEAHLDIIRMRGNTRFLFGVIFVLVISMIVILSSILTRIISQPIQKLSSEVSKISSGNFEYRIPVESTDEIGILTKTFNNMADNLYEHTQNILTLNKVKRRLEYNIYTDPLTEIPNRRYFIESSPKLISDVLSNNQDIFLVLFDIDHFKKINDTYGHAVGDEVIKKISKIVKSNMRPYDLLARYGGEEFIILMPYTEKNMINNLVERIRINVCTNEIKIDDFVLSVSASFGISQVFHIDDIDNAIKRADEALYISKKEGRNQISIKFD